MKDQLLGTALLTIIGLTLFERLIDVLMFVACLYCLAFVMAEVGVWLGVLERK